jgi:hypothetical protein
MAKAAHVIHMPDSSKSRTTGTSALRKKLPGKPARTTIQISQFTKMTLDQIKEMELLETNDDAINFLIRERRKQLPSTFGCAPDRGPFEREDGDDPYRVSH